MNLYLYRTDTHLLKIIFYIVCHVFDDSLCHELEMSYTFYEVLLANFNNFVMNGWINFVW